MSDNSEIILRTANTQLPSQAEMTEIAAKEMQRPQIDGKAGVHYVDFTTIVKLCEELGLDASLFKIDNRRSDEILGLGNALLNELVERILIRTPPHEVLKRLDDCYEYLSEADEPKAFGTGPNFARNQWYTDEDGIRIVLGEFIRLRNAITFDSV